MGDANSFVLKTDDANFTKRQHNVFDQLLALEKSRTPQPMEVDEKEKVVKPSRAVTKPFRGKESIFKKPHHPVPKNYINKIPDFKKNPHKWTRYSLDDVKDEDISDRSNTRTALSFLNELKNRKNTDEIDETLTNAPEKIIFKRHTNLSKPKPVDNEDKPTFKSSKLVMPEYVVGQKLKKEKKNRAIKSGKTKELKLNHLFDEDEEESI